MKSDSIKTEFSVCNSRTATFKQLQLHLNLFFPYANHVIISRPHHVTLVSVDCYGINNQRLEKNHDKILSNCQDCREDMLKKVSESRPVLEIRKNSSWSNRV